jgi:pyruvate,orthophosphate dikinase
MQKTESSTKTAPKNLVYFFGDGRADGSETQKDLLGGKGANLAEMVRLGIPVPPGFTISTWVCHDFNLRAQNRSSTPKLSDSLLNEVRKALSEVENLTGRTFGGEKKPLLVSVRSGAAVSMPGMMDTILNLGLNFKTVEALAKESHNPRFAWDSFRRFLQMYGNVVLGIPSREFEELLEDKKKTRGVEEDTQLDQDALQELSTSFESKIQEHTGTPFPQDPWEQLLGAIKAVLSSWNNERANLYRRLHGITGLLGTAVNVQAMVFGNLGETSGTGVAFTRDPGTGENKPYGEFLVNAQGEDVVAGVRTPLPLQEMGTVFPEASKKLLEVMSILENHYRDMQDLEFTIQESKLYLLQTRSGKRTAKAALKIATDMVDEKLISKPEAILRLDAVQCEQVLHPQFDPKAKKIHLAWGISAAPGSAVGEIALSPEKAVERASAGISVILVRQETSPEDLEGMASAGGILTARGGKTSHAAVVARQMGKVCVSGVQELEIDETKKRIRLGKADLKEGDLISIDGSIGEVFLGEVPLLEASLPKELLLVQSWADKYRKLKIRTNADTPQDAIKAREFGAEGIGLCRTEHMFFGEDRILHVRGMILAKTKAERMKALEALLPMQRSDFHGIFRAMDGLPVNIRLLDPPLHEFLPKEEEAIRAVAHELGVSPREIKKRTSELSEVNPMLGLRGCRLGITFPEIYEMQVRAILEAAVDARKEGIDPKPEIMIPLSSTAQELSVLQKLVEDCATSVFSERGMECPFAYGTMIETPRAALTAERIAGVAEFFSFGTNDLTQMTFGYSRDDSASFLIPYLQDGILERDPFVTIDKEGVGRLMAIAVQEGRKTRKDLKVGICGESGGEPQSIHFCHRIDLDYVSCSPYRVPTARLSAAQAALSP